MAEINDFGKKIGGARKDIWAGRGLISSDLDEMNDFERQSHIKKDNIWIKPDWQKLVSDGIPQGVAYWQNKMRQSIPPKPEKDDEYWQTNYVNVVGQIRDAVMAVRDPIEVDTFYSQFLKPNYIVPHGRSYYVDIIPEADGIITNKVLKAAQSKYRSMEKEAKDKLFGIPKDKQSYEKAKNSLSVHLYDGKNTNLDPRPGEPSSVLSVSMGYGHYFYYLDKGTEFSDPDKWKTDTYFVLDENHRRPLENNFPTREAALAYVEVYALRAQEQENKSPEKKGKTSKKKSSFVPPQLQHIKRDGPNYRKDRPANSKMFLDELKFRGGEFGNWLNNDDRQVSLNMAYDGLRDLARVLNISPEDVALSGKLAIAFGARGRGGANSAAAHYEPDRQVINLTKMSGAGCLAHEWGHALDHAIGIASGQVNLASEVKRKSLLPQSFGDVLSAMRYKVTVVPAEEIAEGEFTHIKSSRRELKNWLDSVKPSNLSKAMEHDWDVVSQKIIDSASQFTGAEYMSAGRPILTKPEVEMLSQIRKTATNHTIPRATKHQIALWAAKLARHEKTVKEASPSRRAVETDFYKGSVEFDKLFSRASHGYWQSECEMFARAFDCYVADKIKEAGLKSNYLTGYADSYVVSGGNGKKIAAIPLGEERKVIFEKIDLLLADLKERGLLHDFCEEVEVSMEESKPERRNRNSNFYEPFDPNAPRPKYEQLSLDDMLFAASARAGQNNSHNDKSPAHSR